MPSEQPKTEDKRGRAIQIKDIIYGEPQPLEDGVFEINALVSLQAGNKPVFGVTGQFLVNAVRVGNPQAITDGKISETLTVSGKKAVISLETTSDYFGDKIFPLRNIELPEKKKSDDGDVRIIIVVTRDVDNTLFATMARVNKKGIGTPGKITYVDKHPETVSTDEEGYVTVPLPNEEKRRVAFFPTEFPKKKIRVYIFGKTRNTAPAETPCSLMVKLNTAFSKGWDSLNTEACSAKTERMAANES